ncbi:SAM-dependent methyltransferase [Saccharopolyspora phatthalungensis]|uniref:SAM-dependent methyltransferase n=1 Tax=Saccharopolyspora phatthalungensis TaxID=664693 RepID=A0A840QEG4_9PSEU|nr:SAM-dependent methyltransferase [Saccharopolyspora phatthalungensis]MBB5157068.1 SAM-dependent methyltransferase [Saccharopolyspora phatthalungensis]
MSMDEAGHPLPEIDVSIPSPARIYDYWLGGNHNFAVDREVGSKAAEVMPTLRAAIWANRAFLRRVVTYLATEHRVDQFLDLGSGVPTVGNVHEVAQAANPEAKVAYVDIEPVAVAHGRHLLAGNDRATVIQADLRQPADVLGHPEVTELLDLSRPVAVLLIAVLHFIPDSDRPGEIVRTYLERTAPGSFVALSHADDDEDLPAEQARMLDEYRKSTRVPFVHRGRSELAAWLDGFDLEPPGIVRTNEWHPDEEAAPILRTHGVVARKPTGCPENLTGAKV